MYTYVYTYLYSYKAANAWVTRKWYTIWTKRWEIAGLCHFMWGKYKENCLKNTKVLQVNAQQLQKDCYFMKHFPLLFLSLSRICSVLGMYKLASQFCSLASFRAQPRTLLSDALALSQEKVRKTQLPTCKGEQSLEEKCPFLIFKMEPLELSLLHWCPRLEGL